MKLNHTINNCREFVVFGDTVAFINEDYNFIIDDRIILKGKFTISGSYADKVILFDNDNFKALIYNVDGNLFKEVTEFAIIKRSEVINGEFIAGTNDGKKITFILCEAENFDVKKHLGDLKDLNGLNGLYLAIKNKYFVSKSKKQIGLFDFNNQPIWLRSFSDFTSSETNFIGARMISLNDRLFFQVSSEVKKGLFSVDVKTGELLNFYAEATGFLVTDNKFVYSLKYPNIICVINPFNGECLEWDVNDLIKEIGFETFSQSKCTVDEGLIYFAQILGADFAKILVMDPFKRKLITNYDFKPKSGGVSNISVAENKIYILTGDCKLFVFEPVSLHG